MFHKQLTDEDRRDIERYLNIEKHSMRHIARLLKRSPSTISREIKRGSVVRKGSKEKIYDWRRAKHKAYVRKKYAKYQKKKIISDMKLRAYIEEHLCMGWSPKEISLRVGEQLGLTLVSKNTIYRYIQSPHGRQLEHELGYELISRKKKYGQPKTQKTLSLEQRVFIDERPSIIDNRERYGDWEGDFIVSGKDGSGVLLVLHERKSRYIMVRKLSGRKIGEVHEAMKALSVRLKGFHSLTLDNDIAFMQHQRMSEEIEAPIYFCHAYHSWEKGGVEYSNRLIREYIPKGSDISQWTDEQVHRIEYLLNTRPREILKGKTPIEIMDENNQFTQGFDPYPGLPHQPDIMWLVDYDKTHTKKHP